MDALDILDDKAAGAATAAFSSALPKHRGQMTTAELLYALTEALIAYEQARGPKLAEVGKS